MSRKKYLLDVKKQKLTLMYLSGPKTQQPKRKRWKAVRHEAGAEGTTELPVEGSTFYKEGSRR